MIDRAVSFLKDELNTYIASKRVESDNVEITALNDYTTGSAVNIPDKIGMTVVNVEEERMFRSQAPQTINNNGTFTMANPPLKVNIYILFTAHNPLHKEALTILSYVMQCFQVRNAFDNQRSPQLGESIERLMVDMYSLNFEQQNQLWASLGAKYLPSVLYKVRMLIINEKQAGQVTPGIGQLNNMFSGGRE
ncbi:MAG: hypothetical protein FD123_856 [Bacteroidetes bacterium]|nr:MAG: hypothetical protein FD123_856 [Bacteroidota bacterium]